MTTAATRVLVSAIAATLLVIVVRLALSGLDHIVIAGSR